ncbi:type A2 lantipeptide [aff. Roholtiella sp. LEGE 12411]|uniref:type A2 lantipeptide n=1 Tax=aff. Roholtiella sp. LEGE 12411 TaxID=1828822 RepID=UPI00187DDFA6|nr:type A2 lantipeptide [aff. Roholtiella sp. LEGE 12411]MBE9035713.1 type A2 lantipeptide [aff. Roholtiella sp. LEGE 12411]
MSNPNENPENENQQVNDAISINENGEVVIKDPKLAEVLLELSPEELDAIAGGNGNCGNCNCGRLAEDTLE